MGRILLVIAFIFLGVLTVLAIWNEGLTAIFASIFTSYASAQIFADLFISLLLIIVWMWHDARANGRNPSPWIVATFMVGVFSPLLYLLTGKRQSKPSIT